MKPSLGRQEAQLLAYVQLRGLRTVELGELTGPLRLSPEQEQELLRRMARGGIIARVRPGLYLVPEKLPLGGAWTPSEALALNTLMNDRGGTYQICGPNAFNRYGFDDQVPTRVYAYNDRISGERTIGAVALTLIKVKAERLGATKEVTTPDGVTAVYSSRARTLLDAIDDWARFNSLPRGYAWTRLDLDRNRVEAAELVDVTVRFGAVGTIRRMGLLLDKQGVGEQQLARLEKALRPTSAYIPWIPTLPKRGKVNQRWGVVDNEPR
ncbi:MAG: hypothetical protein PVJ51_14500, partial [Acidobacteriota bacterium]